MKSKLFSRFDPKAKDNQEFADDLAYTLTLKEKELSICSKALVPYFLAQLPSEEERILNEVERDTQLPRVKFSKAMNVMGLFLKKLGESEKQDDTPADWATDLRELGLIDSKDKPKQAVFLKMAESIKTESVRFRDEINRRKYASGVLPLFKSCGHTVELRAVQEEQYKWGDDVNKYTPCVIGTVPIVCINIGTDASSNNNFYFQMRSDQIDFLIDEMRSAKIEIDSLKRYVEGKDPQRKVQEV